MTGVDFVCFTDDPGLKSEFWDIRYVGRSLIDPARHSKRYKALHYVYLPDYDESIYIDNRVTLTASIGDIFDLLKSKEYRSPILSFVHPWRDCVYAEAQAVLKAGYDLPAVVGAQMAEYRALGYPEKNGLNALPMIVRRHDAVLLNSVMQEWHGQVLRHSKRDQLSFNVVAWFHGLGLGHLPGSLIDNALMKWPTPNKGVRVPRDFDDARYAQLHPDVALSGMPPRKHYLLYGHKEGRRYK